MTPQKFKKPLQCGRPNGELLVSWRRHCVPSCVTGLRVPTEPQTKGKVIFNTTWPSELGSATTCRRHREVEDDGDRNLHVNYLFESESYRTSGVKLSLSTTSTRNMLSLQPSAEENNDTMSNLEAYKPSGVKKNPVQGAVTDIVVVGCAEESVESSEEGRCRE